MEVAVGSVALDRENASLYAEAGLTGYWIVLGENEQVEVYRRPENGIYQEKITYSRGDAIPCGIVADGAVRAEEWFA